LDHDGYLCTCAEAVVTPLLVQRSSIFLARIARTTYVDAAYCYRPSSVVCRSVCLSVCLSVCHSSEPVKMAEPIDSLCRLGWGLGWAQATMYYMGVEIPHGKGLDGEGASHCTV